MAKSIKMKFKDQVNNLIEKESEFALEAIYLLRNKGFAFPAVYLPNFMPENEVDYFFVAMEPSFGKWESVENAKHLISNGFRNFIFSKEDFLLHYSIKKYLKANYHITDVSKTAMKVKDADQARKFMYNFWGEYLKLEIETLRSKEAKIIAIGGKSEDKLLKLLPNQKINKIIHFSGAARGARSSFAENHKILFNEFKEEFDNDHFVKFTDDFLNKKIENTNVKNFIKNHGLKKLESMNNIDLQLLFSYKKEFETLK